MKVFKDIRCSEGQMEAVRNVLSVHVAQRVE